MKYNVTILRLFIIGLWFNANSQIDYGSFEGEPVKTSIELNLKNVFFKEYSNERFKRFEELIVKNDVQSTGSPIEVLHSMYSASNQDDYKSLFIGKPTKISTKELEKRKLSDTLANKLRLIHRLTFDYDGSPIAFLKYKKFKDSLNYTSELVTLRKQKDSEQWFLVSQTEFPGTEYAIKTLKGEGFWQFFNRHDEEKHPKINKYKPQVQDSDGVLDIEKLGEFLMVNKGSLSEYID